MSSLKLRSHFQEGHPGYFVNLSSIDDKSNLKLTYFCMVTKLPKMNQINVRFSKY